MHEKRPPTEGEHIVLQMVREQTATAAPETADSSARFVQCRLPAEQYEWLRFRAFQRRTSMNSIVLKAIYELRAGTPEAETPMPMPIAAGTSGGVKFNVRLSESSYEWLRTKAFTSRGSINQLLIAALAMHRSRVGA